MTISLRRVAKLTAVTVGLALPAFTQTACEVHGCPDNRLCLFEGGNYSSHTYRFAVGDNDTWYQDNHWIGQGDNQVDNDTSSVVNNSNRWVTVYRDKDYESHSVCIEPGASVQNMSKFVISFAPNTTMDNKASSHEWGSTTAPANGKSNCSFTQNK